MKPADISAVMATTKQAFDAAYAEAGSGSDIFNNGEAMNTHRTEALKIAETMARADHLQALFDQYVAGNIVHGKMPAAKVRDGRTLLPISAQEIADELNGRAHWLDRVTLAASRCWVAVSDAMHDMHVAYLRWELKRVTMAIEHMPTERAQLHAAEDRRHKARTVAINHEAERRMMEANQRREVLVRDIQSLAGLQ
jgi:hypothetical protein